MGETPEPDKEKNSQQEPDKLPLPKRGAFPTPRPEIEKAPRYIPETDQDDDKSATKPGSPEKADHEDGQQAQDKS